VTTMVEIQHEQPKRKRFWRKGDRREVSTETRQRISEACSLHGGYKELKRWKAGKRPDRRTPFGRYIATVEETIVEDLGGHRALTQRQRLLLDRVVEKLIFLERIGAWTMEQERILDVKGELVACLGKSYIAFNNALRLDLAALYETDGKGKGRVPTLKQVIEEESK
jgi:hypothetical protein